MRYWNIAPQRYCRRLARYWRALRLSADRATGAPGHTRGKGRRLGAASPAAAKFTAETDSLVEGGGFEPSVPRKTVAVVDTARCPVRHLSMLWRSEPDFLQNRFGALCMRSRSPLLLSREPENSRDRGQTAW